ncbi:uncharacterized protein LOC107367805 [Tetranychus urticae]|uniref:uncharacterized protein LOC107367805 n=1 Tax=Tetranychus urticae TaxID=32264 RepID=UPI00077B9ACF|nr:uncharacterized protein LOC107367805 [Tetranychus urticae]
MSQSNFRFVSSSRGGKLLVIDNHIFRRKKTINDTEYYYCVKSNCKSSATLQNSLLIRSSPHSHEPDTGELIRYEHKNEAKKLIKDSEYPKLCQVYDEVTDKILNDGRFSKNEAASSVQPFGSVRATLNRARQERFGALPASRAGIVVPDSLKCNSSGQIFLRYQDEGEDKILLFVTDAFLKLLVESEHVYGDGTFKSVPKLFQSLYTLHVMKNGMMIPIVYALLPNATTQTYIAMLRIIQDLCFNCGLTWNPKKFTTDFEIATINAIKAVFPSCEIKSCLFHFCQSIWRNTVKHNLAERYQCSDDDPVKVAIKRISALPFLKVEDVSPTFDSILAQSPTDENFLAFVNYFRRNYINDNARFPIDTWNHFNSRDPRTNNHLEGWHFALNRSVGRYHANLWFYIEKLVKQQNNFEINLLMASFGTQVVTQARKYKINDQKIYNLTQSYIDCELSPLEFIDRVRYSTFVSDCIVFS